MTLKSKIISGVAALALSAGAFAATQAAPQHRHGFRARMFSRMAQELNLNDTQKQFAHDLFKQSREQAKPIVDQLRAGHDKMAAAVKAGDEQQIDQIAQNQAQLQGQVAAIHAKSMAKFYAQLTPDQKTKADALHERMKGRLEHWRQRTAPAEVPEG